MSILLSLRYAELSILDKALLVSVGLCQKLVNSLTIETNTNSLLFYTLYIYIYIYILYDGNSYLHSRL